ncbi:MAG: hypothetical protein KatS3mg024_1465 [Armatimonadota bacterium]|nr:MAG: hypothetical protein KatS3mg024_1465 [Armatimonadota bacterium]
MKAVLDPGQNLNNRAAVTLLARQVRLTAISAGSGFGHVFVFTAPQSNCIAFIAQKDGGVAVGADRAHAICQIRSSDAGFILVGTVEKLDPVIRVNARPLEGATVLKEGDTLRIGEAVFLFETCLAPDPSLRGRDLTEEQGMARVYEALKALARGVGVGREAHQHRHGAGRR